MLQIVFTRQGRQEERDLGEAFVIGRSPLAGTAVDLDLAPDGSVSRRHARIWLEAGQYCIQDLNSSNGTFVNDVPISGQGKCLLQSGDSIRIGECTLLVKSRAPQSVAGASAAPAPAPAPVAAEGAASVKTPCGTLDGVVPAAPSIADAPPARDDSTGEPGVEIAGALDANASACLIPGASAEDTARRLQALYRMSREFGAAMSIELFARLVVERLMEIFPRATRGSFALYDRDRDELLLKAGASPGELGLSETLARRAMTEMRGFIWHRYGERDDFLLHTDAGSEESLPSRSMRNPEFRCGMYAPLLWQGQALGVVCVDGPAKQGFMTEDELRLMVAVAQTAAPAVANHHLQRELERERRTRDNLLRHFSPKVAQRILNTRGRTRLGGTRSEVTILCSDIRGFTRIAKNMEPDDVVDLLNTCFCRLVPILFAQDGTLDKYVGDAILGVFGSPDPDPAQYQKAVRAAWRMQASVRELNAERAARNEVTFGMGIGIHCGEVVHGLIGSTEQMEFTVIGDAVNYASRYCDAAGDGEILISPEVHQHVWKIVKAKEVNIATKHEGSLRAYRIQEVNC
jgi:adenylate cyclase